MPDDEGYADQQQHSSTRPNKLIESSKIFVAIRWLLSTELHEIKPDQNQKDEIWFASVPLRVGFIDVVKFHINEINS